MKQIDDIAQLLNNEETLNLGLNLLCKKYNCEIVSKHIDTKSYRLGSEYYNNTLVTIILTSLDTSVKLKYQSLNNLKLQLKQAMSKNNMYCNVNNADIDFPNIQTKFWITKRQ